MRYIKEVRECGSISKVSWARNLDLLFLYDFGLIIYHRYAIMKAETNSDPIIQLYVKEGQDATGNKMAAKDDPSSY